LVEDYSPFLSELSMFRVYLHATVDETDQLTATFADFRLILPQLDIVVRHSTTYPPPPPLLHGSAARRCDQSVCLSAIEHARQASQSRLQPNCS